jgi:hypothetical protein
MILVWIAAYIFIMVMVLISDPNTSATKALTIAIVMIVIRWLLNHRRSLYYIWNKSQGYRVEWCRQCSGRGKVYEGYDTVMGPRTRTTPCQSCGGSGFHNWGRPIRRNDD